LNDNYIKCPRCGEEVYYDLTRCSNCNLSLYPQEVDLGEEEFLGNPVNGFDDWPISPGALLIGWLVSSAIIIGLHIFLSRFGVIGVSTYRGRLILLGIDPIGMMIAGYISGMMVSQRPALHGSILGIIGIGISIFMEMYWRDIKLEGLIRIDIVVSWILIVVSAISGTVIAYRRAHRFDGKLISVDIEGALYDNLLMKVGYNSNVVQRLIEFERNKDPGAGRVLLLRRAINRWERDNR